jgi:hypothetical protein
MQAGTRSSDHTVNGVNNVRWGHCQLARENKEIALLPFNPLPTGAMKTSRRIDACDKDIPCRTWPAMKEQVGITEPTRDWFPISQWAHLQILLISLRAEASGAGSCGCTTVVSAAPMINKEMKEMAPVLRVSNIPGLVKAAENYRCEAKMVSNLMMGLALLRTIDPSAPKSWLL